MSREFKKTFFTSLMAVLLVVSNLIGLKLTNFFDLTISVDFLTYPFIYLCTLLIYNTGDKKAAYQSILVAALIQIFITISYTLAISLGDQSVMPDMATYVNVLFKIDETKILASLLAFLVSNYVLVYICENFKKYSKQLFGIVMGLLVALFVNSTIYLLITLRDYEIIYILNMLLSSIIISIIMVVIITILFYLLKENDSESVIINKMSISVSSKNDEDKAVDELIMTKVDKQKSKKKKNYKSRTNSKTNSKTKTNSKAKTKKK